MVGRGGIRVALKWPASRQPINKRVSNVTIDVGSNYSNIIDETHQEEGGPTLRADAILDHGFSKFHQPKIKAMGFVIEVVRRISNGTQRWVGTRNGGGRGGRGFKGTFIR